MNKDALYMKDKNMQLCIICEYAVYDAIQERGFNCNNRESSHFCRDWSLPVASITSCTGFCFAVPSAKRWVEDQVKRNEAKAQTTLGDF